jgi:hypothetical protein
MSLSNKLLAFVLRQAIDVRDRAVPARVERYCIDNSVYLCRISITRPSPSR